MNEIKILKRATSVYYRGDHVEPDKSIIVTDKKEVSLVSINLGINYGALGHPMLALEEEEEMDLSGPALQINETLESKAGNYLKFPESYISVSKIRPWGVGIHEGDVVTRSIRVNEIKDLFRTSWKALIHQPDEFNHPVTGGYNVKFYRKRNFQRTFGEEIRLPIFSMKSLEEHIMTGCFPRPKRELRSYMRSIFPSTKLKVMNKGFTLDADNVRNYVIENVKPQFQDSQSFNYMQQLKTEFLGKGVKV